MVADNLSAATPILRGTDYGGPSISGSPRFAINLNRGRPAGKSSAVAQARADRDISPADTVVERVNRARNLAYLQRSTMPLAYNSIRAQLILPAGNNETDLVDDKATKPAPTQTPYRSPAPPDIESKPRESAAGSQPTGHVVNTAA